MTFKELILFFLPFSILIYAFKIFLTNFILFYPGDILFALSIASISLISFNKICYIYLFFTGSLRGLDLINIEILMGLCFIGIGFLWEHFERYFEIKNFESRLMLWFIILVIYEFVNLIILLTFKLKMEIEPFIIINLLMHSFLNILLTYIWILFFYYLIKKLYLR